MSPTASGSGSRIRHPPREISPKTPCIRNRLRSLVLAGCVNTFARIERRVCDRFLLIRWGVLFWMSASASVASSTDIVICLVPHSQLLWQSAVVFSRYSSRRHPRRRYQTLGRVPAYVSRAGKTSGRPMEKLAHGSDMCENTTAVGHIAACGDAFSLDQLCWSWARKRGGCCRLPTPPTGRRISTAEPGPGSAPRKTVVRFLILHRIRETHGVFVGGSANSLELYRIGCRC